MKIKNHIAGSILIFAISACVVPGFSQPAPSAFEPNTIPTMVVLTANAAMAQTAAAASPTPTPLPTESATATPRISLSGTSLFLRDDRATVFIDHQTGVELIIPTGWLAVRVNEPEYYDAWGLPELSDPAFQHALTNIQKVNPSEVRLTILDTHGEHLLGGFVTNIGLFWYENNDFSLENNKDLLASADSLPETMPGLKVLSSKLSANSSGIPIGINTFKRSVKNAEGKNEVIYFKQVFVKTRTGVLTITLTTPEDLKEIVFPTFDAMIEAMTLVKE
jgi:hypothetical protein